MNNNMADEKKETSETNSGIAGLIGIALYTASIVGLAHLTDNKENTTPKPPVQSGPSVSAKLMLEP